MGGMASAAADDFKIGVGLKDDPERGRPGVKRGDELTDYQRRTAASVESNRRQNARSGEYDEERAKKSTMARAAAPAPNFSSTLIADPLPSAVPDPDEIGDTEQNLLDANRKGRSSTIATSPAGLLADEDSTRKKRSLMGGLIS